ncbi:TIGR02391 family protein [Umezawaea endophytica]|uniref:TIGR02391 family protein n=1 Tax=Umezawaea endophytica TaxID=1654476 RepID=A0A9X2VXD1_9PSEU|nr:TIGR02391 family protein [Umezawaea endophytica]MCS7484414.1 TIGR02391 family protein [Umezawaea endophytica]
MDVEWAIEKLVRFAQSFDDANSESNFDWSCPDILHRQAPTVIRILKEIDIYAAIGGYTSEPFVHREFLQLKTLAMQGIGTLEDFHEIEKHLKPDSPSIKADQFHPWVWDAAQTFWRSKHYKAAVHSAAMAINAHLQNKVDRRDISDDKLVGRCFSESPPDSGNPRIRIKGDHADSTIQSIQRGAGQLGFACFWAIRNPAAHSSDEWPISVALENLAVLSKFARILDEAEIDTVERMSTGPQ